MDQQTPSPLAPYPAPQMPKEPRQMSVGAQRMLFLLLGLGIGGIIVIATIGLFGDSQKIVYRDNPVNKTSTTTAGQTGAGIQPPVDDKTASPTTKPDPTKPPATGPDPAKAAGSDKTIVGPYNPFGPAPSGLGAAMPSKEISGHISTDPPAQPEKSGGKGPSQPVTASPTFTTGLLVSVRLDVSDPTSALRALQAVAAKLGGSAVQYDEVAAKDEPEGAVLFVPAAKAGDAEKQVGSVGSIVVSDHWDGSAENRLDRLEANAQNRLSDLNIKRQELLVKYFDDAPQVKHIDEDAARIKKCISAVRSHRPGLNVAVIKVKFLS